MKLEIVKSSNTLYVFFHIILMCCFVFFKATTLIFSLICLSYVDQEDQEDQYYWEIQYVNIPLVTVVLKFFGQLWIVLLEYGAAKIVEKWKLVVLTHWSKILSNYQFVFNNILSNQTMRELTKKKNIFYNFTYSSKSSSAN